MFQAFRLFFDFCGLRDCLRRIVSISHLLYSNDTTTADDCVRTVSLFFRRYIVVYSQWPPARLIRLCNKSARICLLYQCQDFWEFPCGLTQSVQPKYLSNGQYLNLLYPLYKAYQSIHFRSTRKSLQIGLNF